MKKQLLVISLALVLTAACTKTEEAFAPASAPVEERTEVIQEDELAVEEEGIEEEGEEGAEDELASAPAES
jgi:nitrous oxide reductase accessory protein NosL